MKLELFQVNYYLGKYFEQSFCESSLDFEFKGEEPERNFGEEPEPEKNFGESK